MTQVIETKQVNITIEQGATFQMFFVVRDDEENLVSLVGATVVAQLREYAEASDYFQFTATHNGAGGRVTITMPYDDTAKIPYTSGVYDVYIYYANNTRDKCIEGNVTIVPGVTKPIAGEIIYLLSFAKEADFPNTGMVRRVYFSHATNKMYRWNGTGYVSIITDGEAATVEVGTVTTLDPGEDATVENVGSLTNAVFEFGIPKGDPGTTSWDGIEDKPETFPPSSHNHDDRYYTEGETNTLLSAKADTADLGDLAVKDKVDYDTDITNLPSLGSLASKDTVDYTTEVTNKPTLGTMAAVNDAPSDNKQYARKNGAWAEVTGGSGGGSWGSITGTLSDQTDLQTALDNKADIIISNASGAIASFSDGAPYPVTALTVGVEPVQDLHGYSNPWPAGGGVNKFDGVTYRDYIPMSVASGQTALIQAVYNSDQVGYLTLRTYDSSKNFLQSTTTSTVSGSVRFGYITLTSDASYIQVQQPTDTATSNYSNVMVCVGVNTPQTYAPYSNICPISGHTTATVTRTGKNLFGGYEQKTYVKPNTWYIFSSGTLPNSETSRVRFKLFDSNDNEIIGASVEAGSSWYIAGNNIANLSSNVSSLNGCKLCINADKLAYIKFLDDTSTGYNYVQFTNFQLELGSTATSYEAPSIQQVTISLGSTVYGGVVDVVNGTLTIDKGYATLNGSETWYDYALYNGFSTELSGVKFGTRQNGMADWLSPVPVAGNVLGYWMGVSNLRFYVLQADSLIPSHSIENWQAYLAQHPLHVVYPLATPIEVTLTPETLSTLLGDNAIWADTGDTNVSYRADTKLFIDSHIAQTANVTRAMIADSATADGKAPKSLASGDLIIVGDELRKCTSNIGSGTAIASTNSTTATLADVIKALQTQ